MKGKNSKRKKETALTFLYRKDLSDDEELLIYYSYDKASKTVEDIRFLYNYYVAGAFERSGKEGGLLTYIHQEKGLDELLVDADKILGDFVQHFSIKYEKPEIITTDKGVYLVKQFKWIDRSKEKPVLVSIRYNFHDDGPTIHDFKQVLQIIVGEEYSS